MMAVSGEQDIIVVNSERFRIIRKGERALAERPAGQLQQGHELAG